MEWNTARDGPKGVGVLLALGLLAGMLSFNLNDPTVTNLRYPSTGVGNLLGLPGALVAGSLVEFLGASALFAPWLLLQWFLSPRGRPPLYRYLFWSLLLSLSASGLHGIFADGFLADGMRAQGWAWSVPTVGVAAPAGAVAADPGLGSAGVVGLLLYRWSVLSGGLWLGGALLTLAATIAATRLLYAPLPATVLRDAGTFLGAGLRALAGRIDAAGAVTRRGVLNTRAALSVTGEGARRGLGYGLKACWRGMTLPMRLTRARIAEWRDPSLAGIKAAAPASVWTPRAPFAAEAGQRSADNAALEEDWYDLPSAADLLGAEPEQGVGAEPAGIRDEEAPPPRTAHRRGSEWAERSHPAEVRFEHDGEADRPEDSEDGSGAVDTGVADQGQARAAEADDGAKDDADDRSESDSEDGFWQDATGDESPRSVARSTPDAATVTGAEGGAGALPERDTGYAFERPEAEAAWRERFRRYARTLDLDWRESSWNGSGDEETPPPEDGPGKGQT